MENIKQFVNRQYNMAVADPSYCQVREDQAFGALSYHLSLYPDHYDELVAYWDEMRSKFFEIIIAQRVG